MRNGTTVSSTVMAKARPAWFLLLGACLAMCAPLCGEPRLGQTGVQCLLLRKRSEPPIRMRGKLRDFHCS